MSSGSHLDRLRAVARTEHKLDVPTHDGHVARNCPQCQRLFTVAVAAKHPSELACPYCGVRRPASDYLTPGQRQLALEAAARETAAAVAATPGGRPGVVPNAGAALAATERVATRLSCSRCSYGFGVSGTARHCPGCAADPLAA